MHSRHRIAFLSALALVFGLSACDGDSTSPLWGTRISISVESIDPPIISEDVAGEPRIRCNMTLRATATGAKSATWRDATFRFFAGSDRSVPVDSLVFSAEEIEGIWGVTTMRSGQSIESRWWFEYGAPFVVTAEYRYSPVEGAPLASATARVVCGPEPSEAVPPPTITAVTLMPPPDGLEPGDALPVSYTAHAPLGVWSMVIELSGACKKVVRFGEQLHTTASRTRWVQVPPDCVLNVPLYVTVYAVDAALRFAARVTHGPLVVDHTPPVLQASLISRFGIVPDLGAVYFVRDTIEMNAWASDNNAVRWIVYELMPLGIRDSVAMSPSFGNRLRVPLRPEMTGSPLQLRIYARDAAGLPSAPYTTPPDLIHVYPTVERPTLQTTFDGHAVIDMVIDTDRGRIYALQGDRRIRVLSTTTLEMIQTIALPYAPSSVDFTPSGDSLIATHQAGVGVIDVRQPTPVLSEIPVALDASINQQPTRVVVLGNGKAFVTLSGNAPRANVLLELNPATGAQRVRTDAADANGVASVYNMQRTPDRLAFVFKKAMDRFGRYDVATDQFTDGGIVSKPSGSGHLSVARSGAYTSDGRLIFDASLAFVRRVQSIWGGSPGVMATALSADGEYLYIGGTPGLMRSRVSDGQIVDRTMNPIRADIFRVASDDSFVVTATEIGAAQVSLIRIR